MFNVLNRLWILLIGIFLLLIGLSICFVFDLKFNYSHSMPIGFYQVVRHHEIQVGDNIEICLPQKIAEEGLKRGYIPRGVCPYGSASLIKKVIALPGDDVLVTYDGFRVNNKSVFDGPVMLFDRQHYLINRTIHNGFYFNTTGYWVMGSNLYSWDSRYFGPVPRKSIVAVYRYLKNNTKIKWKNRNG